MSMVRLTRFLVFVLLIGLLGAGVARGQERRGSISGHATDVNHDALVGARVEVQPSGYSVTTDQQGAFTISDLTPGKYTLTITYVGFKPFSTEVTVQSGAVTSADEALEIESVNQQVIVPGEREHGEIEALNREINADNIVQVLPAEVITSLPNTNIADAVGRLPSVSLERDEGEGKYVQVRGTEPRLTNLTLDGVHVPSPESVRQVKLDAIPADLIDSVEINKTLSPSQEGDAIGGSVNLVTKRAGERPTATFQAMGGYTPIGVTHRMNEVDSTLGKRFGTDHRLGLIFSGSYDYNERATNDIEPGPDVQTTLSGVSFNGPSTTDIREYKFYRHRYGFAGSADYKLGQSSLVYLRGLFSNFLDHGDDWIFTPSVGNFITPTTTDSTGFADYSHVVRRPEQRIFNVILGANHSLGKTYVAYEVALGQGRSVGGFYSSHFSGPSNVQYTVDTSNPFLPKFIQTGGDNIYDPANYSLGGGNFNFFRTFSFGTQNHILERDLTGAISVSRQYTAHSHFGAFEVGFKVRDAHKTSNFHESIFDSTNSASLAPLSSFTKSLATPDPGFYFSNYRILPLTNYDSIISYYKANPGNFTEATDFEHQINDPNDYTTRERVIAGYVQNTITIGHLKILGGLRIEGTQGSFIGTQVWDPKTGKLVDLPIPGQQTYTNFLPSVQVQYNFNGSTNLRLAYGRGIARPNFADLPPFVLVAPGGRGRASEGNPNLKPTHANDYDVLFEHYLKSVGIVEGGFFYKDLSDPIFLIQTKPTTGPLTDLQVRQPVNGRKAHIAGVEFAWEQHFTSLPGFLSGFGISTNYSYTTSQATFPLDPNTGKPTRLDSPALLRQAPNNWNVDTTYDKGPFSGRLGLSHNDKSIFAYNYVNNDPTNPTPGGIRGPRGDVYYYPHTQVDAQVSYRLPHGHGTHLIVSMLNLNNEVFGFYQGSEQYPIQREYYSRTFAAGLRWTLGSSENK